MKYEMIDSGKLAAQEIMDKDARLLEDLGHKSAPIMHFYEWEGFSATYGYFMDPFRYLDKAEVDRLSVALARRPTGGGLVFHIWDLAFSILIPSAHAAFSANTLENYHTINALVSAAIAEFAARPIPLALIPQDAPSSVAGADRFCMAKPTQYDVVSGKQKIAGAAQRKTKAGFLHQGTISLMKPSEEMLEKLLAPAPGIASAIQENTFPLLDRSATKEDLHDARRQLRFLLKKYLIQRVI